MGAGAGYTIETKDVKIVGDIAINSFEVEQDGSWLVAKVDCNVPIVASVRAESYMYGCPYIEDVPMTVTGISINYMQTAEYPDVTEEDIREVLGNTYNYIGQGVYGGGWTHSTFDGEVELKQFTKLDYTNDINSVDISINDQGVIEFIDLAVQGENLEYEIYVNGEPIESYSTEKEAIAALKEEVLNTLSEEGADSVDFYDSYVESHYYILLNAIGETDIDLDSSQIVYRAEEDFSDDLLDAVGELEEENNPDIDTGFDI